MVRPNCCVCNNLLQLDEKVYVTECNHLFHYGCISRSLKSSEKCPECGKKTTLADIEEIFFGRSNNLDTKIENLQKNQLKLAEEISNLRLEGKAKDNENRELRRRVEELEDNQDRRKIINENGRVIVCDKYSPTTINAGISLFGPVFPSISK